MKVEMNGSKATLEFDTTPVDRLVLTALERLFNRERNTLASPGISGLITRTDNSITAQLWELGVLLDAAKSLEIINRSPYKDATLQAIDRVLELRTAFLGRDNVNPVLIFVGGQADRAMSNAPMAVSVPLREVRDHNLPMAHIVIASKAPATRAPQRVAPPQEDLPSTSLTDVSAVRPVFQRESNEPNAPVVANPIYGRVDESRVIAALPVTEQSASSVSGQQTADAGNAGDMQGLVSSLSNLSIQQPHRPGNSSSRGRS